MIYACKVHLWAMAGPDAKGFGNSRPAYQAWIEVETTRPAATLADVAAVEQSAIGAVMRTDVVQDRFDRLGMAGCVAAMVPLGELASGALSPRRHIQPGGAVSPGAATPKRKRTGKRAKAAA